jgi:putative membrane protein
MELTENKYNKLIIALSVVIPLAVAALFGIKIEGYDFSFLPPIYASINGATAICLIGALIAIKNGNRAVHEKLMMMCLILSACFLVMYVIYHMTSTSTEYRGEWGVIYYPILISHVLLSVAVIPLVLFTYIRALSEQFDKHRKLAKITFPIWLYVAVTGVVVYLMISPYYGQ